MSETQTPESELEATKRRCQELAEEVTQLTIAVQERHSDERRQMKAWALDRAIEVLKPNKDNLSADAAMSTAEKLVSWIFSDEKVQA